MGQSCSDVCKSDYRHILLDKLRNEQSQYSEGTVRWSHVQEKINQIVSENFLYYVNR
jgi:hypothetical protein